MNKDEIIKDLAEKLEMEKAVKKHEVLINASYKETICKLEDQIKFLLKTNEDLWNKVATLKEHVKYLVNEK